MLTHFAGVSARARDRYAPCARPAPRDRSAGYIRESAPVTTTFNAAPIWLRQTPMLGESSITSAVEVTTSAAGLQRRL